MNFPPWLRFHPTDPAYRYTALRHLEGTYKSNWYFLIHATRSNLIHAAIDTSKLIETHRRAITRNPRRAETLFVMNFNYSMNLAGPLLGTVLTVSASLECFLRMIMRAFLEQNTPKPTRGKGTSTMLRKTLGKFDRNQVLPKLEQTYKMILGSQAPQVIVKEFKALVGFRNNCFHGDPVLILSSGDDETTRGGAVLKVYSPKRYPLLWHGNRPLSLSHAIRAVRLHDAVVRDLFVTRSPKLYMHSDIHDENPHFNLIENGLPKRLSPDALDQLAGIWDSSVEQVLEAVPEEEERELLLELQRKATLRPVQ